MVAKPKFSVAPKPPALTAEQAAFIDTGRGKDKVAVPEPASDPAVVSVANQAVPLQRMSIDLPKRLHSRFKAACALAETTMAAEIIAFIEMHTAKLESGKDQSH
jgi:hypothetical protein